ncbi:MAG: hypothetical protein M3Y65_21750 [Pseudomonadota bacterium]|nr:hypothetical protein [Pseudomonadota bacterium]
MKRFILSVALLLAGAACAAPLPDVRFQNTGAGAQTSIPVTFGQVFAVGDMKKSDVLVGKLDGAAVPLQVDVKATHADGSVRHAIISAIVPKLAAGATGTMTLATGGTVPVATSTPADLLATGFTASASATIAGVKYSASADQLLKGATSTWLAGAVANEWQVSAPLTTAAGVAHPHLQARFAVRYYSVVKKARVDVTIENDWAYQPGPQNFIYDAEILVGGKSVYSKAGLNHLHHARWRKLFWWGDAPVVNVQSNVPYLISTRAVPNYDSAVVIADAYLGTMQGTFAGARTEPMGSGMATPYMPTTGGRDDLGIMPSWYAAWIISGDQRARDVSLGTADLAGSWPSHYRDQLTDRPVSIVDHPAMTLLGRNTDTYSPYDGVYQAFPGCAGNCDSVNYPDTAHQAGFAYVPYLLTGDYYYLEELQFWAMYNALIDNPNYRKWEKGLFQNDQVRGQAWSMRTLAEAAYITPDADKLKAQFAGFLDNNLTWYNDTYVTGGANKLGAITNGYAFSYLGDTAIALWQDDHFTSAIGHVAELGFAKAAPLMAWKAKFQIGRMLDPGFCWIDAAAYNAKLRDTATSPIYTSMAQVYQNSVDPKLASLKCNSPEQLTYRNSIRSGDEAVPFALNDMPGYATSTVGYPSNFQAALAMAVDSGAPGGAAAWTTFITRAVRPNYGYGPQFDILPRTAGSTLPPPPPDPTAPAPPVVIVPQVAAPTAAGTWKKVADEGSKFAVAANTIVRYGVGSAWLYSKGSGTASNAYFGKDPAVNVAKTVEAFTPTAAAKPGKVTTPSNTKLKGLTGLTLTFFDATKFAPVKVLTGITPSAKGVFTVSDIALIPGAIYGVIVTDASGKVLDVLYPVPAF